MMFRRFALLTAVAALLLPLAACEKGPTGESASIPQGAAKPAAAASTEEPNDNATTDSKEPATADPSGKAAALEGKVYGAGVKLPESTPISTIVANPKDYDGKAVRVEGMITDVCAKRGCWIAMAGDKPGQTMRFKVQDGVMVFPMTSKGKYAVAEGTVKVRELSMEETKEHAAYDAEERGVEHDPASVTEPKTIVMLAGTGSVVRDSK